MLFSLIYAVAKRFIRTITGRSSVAALEIENAVLRHQLAVLRRRVGNFGSDGWTAFSSPRPAGCSHGTDGPPCS
jgi:hypothetical protein